MPNKITPPPKLRIKKYTTSITLVKTNESLYDGWHMFFCCDCKNPVFQYKGEVVKIIPGEKETLTPIAVQCSNPECRRKYQVDSIIEHIDG